MNKEQEVMVVDAEGKSASHADLEVSEGFKTKMHIDLTASIEARWGRAKAHFENETVNRAAFGLLIQSIKNDLPHGEFLPELERRGFDERAARQAMAYARYIFTQPKKNQDRLLEMPVTKVYALAKADPDVVEVLMEDGETLEKTTVRALANELKAVKARLSKMTQELTDTARHAAALNKTKRLSDFSAKTQAVRDETLVQQGQVVYSATALKRMWDDSLGEGLSAEERVARTEFIWFAAHAATARMCALLDDMRASCPDGIANEATMAHALTPNEAQHWLNEWATIEAHLKAEHLVRHERRRQDNAQDVGRPAAPPLAGIKPTAKAKKG